MATPRLLERLEIDAAEVDLCAFRLEHDLALGERRVGAFVHELAVDEVLQAVAGDDRLDARPLEARALDVLRAAEPELVRPVLAAAPPVDAAAVERLRSEEHTSELQSQSNLVCRLLLEKKKKKKKKQPHNNEL